MGFVECIVTLLMTYNLCRAHHTLVLHQQYTCDVPVVQLARALAPQADGFYILGSNHLVLLHLSLFKPLFTSCIPPLQVSCLDRVVVRVVDFKCLEISFPGSNPASAFDAGGYGSI